MKSPRIMGAARAWAGLAVALVFMALAVPARAADPVFPPASRLGLVPPTGMILSNAFPGFADADQNAVIVLGALPAEAYSQLEKTLDPEALKKEGVTLEKREQIETKAGKGFLVTARQVADKTRYRKWLLVVAAGDITALINVQVVDQNSVYTDAVVRAALETLAVRQTVPETEELSLLPFTIGDLAGFSVARVIPGRAVMLTDLPPGKSNDPATQQAPSGSEAHLLLAAMPGGPSDPKEHGNFARTAFTELAGLKDVHVMMSEPLRISGASGYQTMAQAKDVRSGADVMVIQWLRFGSSGFLQMVGVAPTANWTSILSRLRTVRDSITTK